jgi:glycerol-3-phosphate dehydrogenase
MMRIQGKTGQYRVIPLRVALKKFPQLNPAIRYAATYYDGIFLSPERLALALLLDAEKEGVHARSLNYVSILGLNENEVLLKDEVTGHTVSITPKLIVNATGPWIDWTNQTLGLETHYIGPTKGSHLVLDNPELREAIGDHEFFFENNDGRIVLIFPLFDKVMIGTSDLSIDDPDCACCTEEEVDYFIDMIGRVFPAIQVKRDQIVFRFSGVRPLAHSNAKNAGQITRDHHIQEDKLGNIPVFSLIGGKWTSFRAFSEQVTDRVLAFFYFSRKGDTRTLSIGTTKDATLIRTEPFYTDQEIKEMALREKIIHLDDLLLRRTLLAYLGKLNHPLVENFANSLGQALGWDDSRRKAEVERIIALLADLHGVHL